MGLRFHRRLGLGKLMRVNISKSGVSLGIGPPGANVNVSRRGTRTTMGLPGTGLSYQTQKKWGESITSQPLVLIVVALIIVAVVVSALSQ